MWLVPDDNIQINYRIRIKPKSYPFQIKVGFKINPKKRRDFIMDKIVEVMKKEYTKHFPDDKTFRQKKNSDIKYDFTRINSDQSYNDIITNEYEMKRISIQIAEILSIIENEIKPKIITKIKQDLL